MQFRRLADLGPLGIGQLVIVDTSHTGDFEAMIAGISATLADGRGTRRTAGRSTVSERGRFAQDRCTASQATQADQATMVNCILDAAKTGQPRELDFQRHGTDCCRFRYVIRVLGPSEVETFNSVDGQQWTLSHCTDVGLFDDPFGFPEAKNCTQAEDL